MSADNYEFGARRDIYVPSFSTQRGTLTVPSTCIHPEHELAIRPEPPYTFAMNYQDYITIDPNKRGGKPCVRGLRITVYEVLDYLASDMSEEEILEDFPDLTREDFKACIAFAAERERRLLTVPPAA